MDPAAVSFDINLIVAPREMFIWNDEVHGDIAGRAFGFESRRNIAVVGGRVNDDPCIDISGVGLKVQSIFKVEGAMDVA